MARRVLALLVKDLRDALRDGRIVVALLVPIALGALYGATTPKDGERPRATASIAEPAGAGLSDTLERLSRRSVRLDVRHEASAAAVRRAVLGDDADVGIVAGPGLREIRILLPETPTAPAQAIASAVPGAADAAEDRSPASTVRVEVLRADPATQKPYQRMETRTLLVAFAILFYLGMVALMMVPLTLAEELETGTFDALRLAAAPAEILGAKLLNGLLYAVAGTVLIAVISGIHVQRWPLLLGATVALTVASAGFGLLLGLLSASSSQINTYASLLLLPIVGTGVAVAYVTSGPVHDLLAVLPFSQATRLLLDGLGPGHIFGAWLVSFLVVAAWGVAGFALLTRLARRREA